MAQLNIPSNNENEEDNKNEEDLDQYKPVHITPELKPDPREIIEEDLNIAPEWDFDHQHIINTDFKFGAIIDKQHKIYDTERDHAITQEYEGIYNNRNHYKLTPLFPNKDICKHHDEFSNNRMPSFRPLPNAPILSSDGHSFVNHKETDQKEGVIDTNFSSYQNHTSTEPGAAEQKCLQNTTMVYNHPQEKYNTFQKLPYGIESDEHHFEWITEEWTITSSVLHQVKSSSYNDCFTHNFQLQNKIDYVIALYPNGNCRHDGLIDISCYPSRDIREKIKRNEHCNLMIILKLQINNGRIHKRRSKNGSVAFLKLMKLSQIQNCDSLRIKIWIIILEMNIDETADTKFEIKKQLIPMGFKLKWIQHAFAEFERLYGNNKHNIESIIEIITKYQMPKMEKMMNRQKKIEERKARRLTILQTVITNTPHGPNMTIESLTAFKFWHKRRCVIFGIKYKKKIKKNKRKLKLKELFGKFGKIKSIVFDTQNWRKIKYIDIEFENEDATLNTISDCNNNSLKFSGQILRARYATTNYCKAFLQPSIQCSNGSCRKLHSWMTTADIITNEHIENCFADFKRDQIQCESNNKNENKNDTDCIAIENKKHNLPSNDSLILNDEKTTITDINSKRHESTETTETQTKQEKKNETEKGNYGDYKHTESNMELQVSKHNFQYELQMKYENQNDETENLKKQLKTSNKEVQKYYRMCWKLQQANENLTKQWEMQNDNILIYEQQIKEMDILHAKNVKKYESVIKSYKEQCNILQLETNKLKDDNYHDRQQMIQQIVDLNNRLLEYSQRMGNYKKKFNKLDAEMDESNDNGMHTNNCNDLCEEKFVYWLCNIVRLKQYLSLFKQHEYNDITMVEYIDEDVIINELEITKYAHIKLLLRRIDEFKHMRQEFNLLLNNNQNLKQFEQSLMKNGILTIDDLKRNIKNMKDVKRIFKINDKPEMQKILSMIQSQM